MNRQSDSRINISHINAKLILSEILIITIYSACLLETANIVMTHQHKGPLMALSIICLIIGSSILITLLLSRVNEKTYISPLMTLSEAARKVASGDFSVQLKSNRNDDKVDVVTALYYDFNTMVRELASTEMLKKDFVSNVSHELKSPIAVISNYASLLQNKKITEDEKEEYIQRIKITSAELSDMIQNILQLSRLDNQKIKAAPQLFNISEQLLQCILGFDDALEQKNVDLDIDIPDNIMLTSDSGLLKIVWNNLLSNAVKFVDTNGKIAISISCDSSFCTVTISDNGCGIEKSALSHIFDKFYQADPSHSAKGNGLGLAMVKSIIDLLNGSISVQSDVGKGSTFIVKIPDVQ